MCPYEEIWKWLYSTKDKIMLNMLFETTFLVLTDPAHSS